MLEPTTGALLLAESAHDTPGGATPCQLTLTELGVLVPTPLLAVTEYVRAPATAAVVTHVLVELVQPTHAKLVGLPVHVAVNVMLVPMIGDMLLEPSEQETLEGGVACQLTLIEVGELVLPPLLAVTV
ncbi:MAG: hypothetical protein E6H66_19340 [Betaproteobacteria bacterium]|nr:MAG: hypothetical protein E6H66_19340 [Betaproteobacteria bacterium]